MFLENLKLALSAFTTNRLRTFLAVLGIVIGVASVVAITTIGQSATSSVKAQVSSAGLNVISVMPGWNSGKEVARLFTDSLAPKIAENVDGVGEVMPVDTASYLLRNGKNEFQGTVVAASAAFSAFFSYAPAQGRFFTDAENTDGDMVVVLGASVAESLFPSGNAVGQYVKLERSGAVRSFKVIGVMGSRSQTMGMSFDTSVYIPADTYTLRINPTTTVSSYYVNAKDETKVLTVADSVNAYFLKLTGDASSFHVMSPATMLQVYTGITSTLKLFLTGVAAISLIVGGIGIMNIMLVSVTERMREIGVRKALGASSRAIRGQFLTEAVALTVLGGFAGAVAGTLISYLVTAALGWVFSPEVGAFIVAISVSSAVGIFFGLYPASRAASLDPVTALSYE
jgi:putative ABC transport system permease protein